MFRLGGDWFTAAGNILSIPRVPARAAGTCRRRHELLALGLAHG